MDPWLSILEKVVSKIKLMYMYYSLFLSVLTFFLRGTLEESAYMFQLLGLNLLSLLAQNRLAEFHTVSNNARVSFTFAARGQLVLTGGHNYFQLNFFIRKTFHQMILFEPGGKNHPCSPE